MDKQRTDEANEYRKMYASKHWKSLREAVLLRDGFQCQRCGCYLRRGRSHPQAAVVHHIRPHKGNPTLFYDINNLQSICKKEHDSEAQSEDVRGYSKKIGADGWPVDNNHPAMRAKEPTKKGGVG